MLRRLFLILLPCALTCSPAAAPPPPPLAPAPATECVVLASSAAPLASSFTALSPQNDAARLREMATKAASECKAPPTATEAKGCEPARLWASDPRLKEPTSVEMLVPLLEDETLSVHARLYVVDALSEHQEHLAGDAALAGRIVAVAERPQNQKSDWWALAKLVGQLSGASPGVGDRVEALIKGTGETLFTGTMMEDALARSPERYFSVILAIARQPLAPGAIAAVSALAEKSSDLPDARLSQVCGLLLNCIGDTSYPREARGNAAAGSRGCPSFGVALDRVAAWARGESLGEGAISVISMLTIVLDDSNEGDKKKALAVAQAIVANRNNDAYARGEALELLVRRSPGGKALLRRFERDPEPSLREKIAELRAVP